jgi:hypothetical protein
MYGFRSGIYLALGVSLITVGCGPNQSEYKDARELKAAKADSHNNESHDGGHTHYGAGPHGGSLIELGGDDYHAELVLDHDAHAIRIFLLKSDAKTPLLTKSPEATLTLDKDQKLSLKAKPLEGEIDGQSSRFELVDDDFVHKLLDSGFLHGDLSIQIGEKPFQSHLDIHFEHGDSKPDHKHDDDQKPK